MKDRIPIGLGGVCGEIVSHRSPDCPSPLLLSLSAQTALDMTLHMQAKTAAVARLGLYAGRESESGRVA